MRIANDIAMLTRFRSAALLLSTACAAGCGGEPARHYGGPVDEGAAIPLAGALAPGGIAAGTDVVVSGRIGEVCRESGCWLVLRDVVDGRVAEIFVDLLGEDGFTVPPEVLGRRATVAGRIVGERPDRTLVARGVSLQPEAE